MTTSRKPGCLAAFLQLFGVSSGASEPSIALPEEPLPYRLREDFLSFAELSFYHVLQQAVGDWAVVCPKISLDDLFYAKSGQRAINQAYTNKIDRKHVDFLLCQPRTMRPLLGIELDDSSHQRRARQERDRFVEQVFAAAGLPLYRQPVRSTYNVHELTATLREQVGFNEAGRGAATEPEAVSAQKPKAVETAYSPQKFESSLPFSSPTVDTTPHCPHCGQLMVLRTVKKEGAHKGSKFWGCKDYPRCRGMKPYSEI